MTNKSSMPLSRNVVNLKQLQQASKKLEVSLLDPETNTYLVASASRPGFFHEVTIDWDGTEGLCDCPWAQHGGVNCKHVLAALRYHHSEQGNVSFWRSAAAARRQHRPMLVGDSMYLTIRPRG
jgi:uncharacterized Zn finger protein